MRWFSPRRVVVTVLTCGCPSAPPTADAHEGSDTNGEITLSTSSTTMASSVGPSTSAEISATTSNTDTDTPTSEANETDLGFESTSSEGSPGTETSGSSSTTNDAPEPLHVVNATPGGVLLDGRTPIRITFNRPITAEPANLSVRLDATVPIPGVLTVAEATLQFIPERPLAQAGTYTVRVAEVADLQGETLIEPYTFEFEVPSFGNGGASPVLLSVTASEPPTCPHVAMDDQGNVVVVFQQEEAIYAAYYEAGQGWHETERLATGTDAALGMSPGGRIAVLYTATVAEAARVVVRTKTSPARDFDEAELADEDVPHALRVLGPCDLSHQNRAVAVNDAGAIAAAWRTYDTPVYGGDPFPGVVARVRNASMAWELPEHEDTYYVYTETEALGAAMDAQGNAAIIHSTIGSTDATYSRLRFDAASHIWISDELGSFLSQTAPRLQIGRQGEFVRALSTSSLPRGAPDNVPRLTIIGESFAGGEIGTELVLDTGSAPVDVFLSTRGGPWATWVQDGRIGAAGLLENGWYHDLFFASTPYIAFPVITGRGDDTAILAWQHADTIGFGRLAFSLAIVALALDSEGTLDTEGHAAASPRLVFEPESGHGILTWISENAIYATAFHNLPPAE